MTVTYRLFAALIAGILLVSGCGTATESPTSQPPIASDIISTTPNIDTVRGFQSTRQQRQVSPPVGISIPAIDIDGPLTHTGLNPDRTLEVPDFGDISWFNGGAKPGESGPAAILGHVDSHIAPDVFYRLNELNPGDDVTITTESGETLRFVVTRVEQHSKDEFPTEAVYLPSTTPELRLITCGGDFDQRERSYRDNIIAFASLAE
ncbi:class F sortase [Hoyosella rhizosphaerae]|uniref:Class F sortase n=1 Tax=Hoyosella rhizosphaerae TaxID=1755582 RepID=A0A916U2U8_9ACTN|nr:class F sortase [Hoyosella rhizosphaerae]MBN4926660.1 class F sortase [Hoyosella rhizosphaerae]GGC57485.1 class F sortase [Hoyosella rhizosphaerae]